MLTVAMTECEKAERMGALKVVLSVPHMADSRAVSSVVSKVVRMDHWRVAAMDTMWVD